MMMMESTSSTRAFELEDYREKAFEETMSPRANDSDENDLTDEADETSVAHDVSKDALKEDTLPMSTIDLTEETVRYDGDDVEQASIVPSSKEEDKQTPKRRCRCTKKRCCICFIILIIIMLLLFAILMIGANIEGKNFRRAESTLKLYTQDGSVCAMTNSSTDDTMQSFESSEKALGNNVTSDIVHCGECGECSNRQDLEILAATRSTLTKDATSCAYKMFLGRLHVDSCLEDKVGFTESCNDCWVDNIQCTFSYCKFTCVKFKMFGSKKNNDKDGDLNDCLHCDEVMCGSEFLECSGANRRRMGIVSDIGRDANREQCMDVTLDWAMLVPDPTDPKTSSGV